MSALGENVGFSYNNVSYAQDVSSLRRKFCMRLTVVFECTLVGWASV